MGFSYFEKMHMLSLLTTEKSIEKRCGFVTIEVYRH